MFSGLILDVIPPLFGNIQFHLSVYLRLDLTQPLIFYGQLKLVRIKITKRYVFIQCSIQSVGPLKALYTLIPPVIVPAQSGTNSASPGSILATQQLCTKTKSLTFPPLSLVSYSFIQLSELGRQWRERKCPIFETVAKRGFEPGLI